MIVREDRRHARSIQRTFVPKYRSLGIRIDDELRELMRVPLLQNLALALAFIQTG